MKILIVDIETAPNIAYVWGRFKQNIGQNQWVKKGYIMSYAAMWYGEEEIVYEENRTEDDKKIVQSLFALLDEADIVVAHNGARFDFPTIIGRGVVHGLRPPSPYRVVDTLLTARRELRLVSNTLENLCEELDLPRKGGHKKYPGFSLWTGCLAGEEDAWQEMKEYNIQDIVSLAALYERLRPYMKHHPNTLRPEEEDAESTACPKCGSHHSHKRGTYYTQAGIAYQRYQCQSCGGWHRSRATDKTKPRSETRNAV